MRFKILLTLVTHLIITGAELDSRTSTSRIIGGRPVRNQSLTAFQVSIQQENEHNCGGSILDDYHVLTAAHCCWALGNIGDFINKTTIIAGSLVYNNYGTTTIKRTLSDAFPHENYESNELFNINDVCILKLSSSFGHWTNTMRPIQLTVKPPSVGTNCTVSGWGAIKENGTASSTLQIVTIPVHVCNEFYSNIENGVICAGYKEGGKDACQGDSGGPLVCNGQLAGVVSFGIGCARANYYGVYANMSYYRSWIDKKISSISSYLRVSNFVIVFGILITQVLLLYDIL